MPPPRAEARMVYLSNPDNPTGSWLGAEEQMAIVAKLAPGAVLVLDEAYSDFAPPDSMPVLDPEDERVIRVRTFSKAHGMAGARVGYAIASKAIVASFDKIRHHFGVSRLSQEAALASLGDQAFIADVARQVERRPARLRRARRKPRPQGATLGDEFRRHRYG